MPLTLILGVEVGKVQDNVGNEPSLHESEKEPGITGSAGAVRKLQNREPCPEEARPSREQELTKRDKAP